jgi:hypothetical protein
MKKLLIASLAMLSLLFVQCDELEKLTQFDIPYETQFTIPATLGIGLPLDLPTPDINTNIDTELTAETTRPDLIEEIILKEMKMTVTAPNGEDFSFLESISIFINGDSLPELRLAYLENIPSDPGEVITLTKSEEDIKDYILNEKFSLRTSVTTDEAVAQDTDVKVEMIFHVDANLIP